MVVESNKQAISSFELYNLHGQLISINNNNIMTKKIEVMLHDVSSGIYLGKTILINGEIVSSKVIIQ